MGARFIGCDRVQVFLMPPSLRDWVPEGHLVWTVLDAVAELDLSAIYADYRDDGRGHPAYEPSMMVGLMLATDAWAPLVAESDSLVHELSEHEAQAVQQFLEGARRRRRAPRESPRHRR